MDKKFSDDWVVFGMRNGLSSHPIQSLGLIPHKNSKSSHIYSSSGRMYLHKQLKKQNMKKTESPLQRTSGGGFEEVGLATRSFHASTLLTSFVIFIVVK
jgi:hypothetical protein